MHTKCSPDMIVYNSLRDRNKKVSKISVPTLEKILHELVWIFGVDANLIKSKTRKGETVAIRRIYCYVACKLTKESLSDISRFINGKEHSNVIHHRDKVKAFLEVQDPTFLEYWTQYINESKVWAKYEK